MADDRDVRRAVRADQALAMALLRYANSAWFARRYRVETIDQALTVVGHAGVRSLILTEFLGAFFTEAGPMSEFLWEHALASAIASALQPGTNHERDGMYLCGLLHNVGKAVLNAEDPAGYAEVARRIRQHGEDFCDAERFVFGTVHPNAGAVLLEDLPVPRIVKDTALYHHASDDAPASIAVICRKVFLADATAYRVSSAWRMVCGDGEDPPWLRHRIEANLASLSFDDVVSRELGRIRSFIRLQPPTQ